MEKALIVRFIRERQRGVYSVLVSHYADVIDSCAVTMALKLIEEDLEKETGQKTKLNYFSLNSAINKARKPSGNSNVAEKQSKKFVFKDEHEQKSTTKDSPGRFKLE